MYLKTIIDKADEWRIANGYVDKGGYVRVFHGMATGWMAELNDAREYAYAPGCVAVDSSGKCYRADGGNYYDGAGKWVQMSDAA